MTDSVENYDRVCSRMAQDTGHIVISVEYRIGSGASFPYRTGGLLCGSQDTLYGSFERRSGQDHYYGRQCRRKSGSSRMSACQRQRRVYAKKTDSDLSGSDNDYSENSPYLSVRRYGTEYLLTAGKMRDYINFYASAEEDKRSKYLAPLMETDYSNQPDTLILTAECDPLRDEGEEYGRRLKEAGNQVEIHRIQDALHGFFALGVKYYHVQESFAIINRFLDSYGQKESEKNVNPADGE